MNYRDKISISENIFSIANTITETPGDDVRIQLINLVNDLIEKDFPALVQLLYRIDVQEKKLKMLLKQNPEADAAPVIADLIIKRQLQKEITRKQFTRKDNPSREDKW